MPNTKIRVQEERQTFLQVLYARHIRGTSGISVSQPWSRAEPASPWHGMPRLEPCRSRVREFRRLEEGKNIVRIALESEAYGVNKVNVL